MFEQARKHIAEQEGEGSLFDDPEGKGARKEKDKEALEHRHSTLMTSLEEERDLQMEERLQMAASEDMNDHRHWRKEDADVLMSRGQAPLVYPYAREAINWISGMEKRMRKDYKVLPREEGDEQGAEIKTKIIKYTDDVNLSAWHRSKAFKQMAISGLSWLEENLDPEDGKEIIFSGSEDWRNVFRDSRSRHFALDDARYLFRRKVVDSDYAIALLPHAKEHLLNVANSEEDGGDEDDVWYLGQRLTGASDIDTANLPFAMRDRQSFIGGAGRADRGRRRQVELLESWYRVATSVDVFDNGPLAGKAVNQKDAGHQQLLRDGHRVYNTVRMQMRVMVCTKDQALWDGVSPFRHNRFPLIPVWGYRRYSDGMCFGMMLGMRDLMDNINKRNSKIMHLLNSNRIKMEKNAVDDIETLRQEAARPDGIIEVNKGYELSFDVHANEVAGQLQVLERDILSLQESAGVTRENLGRGPASQSGIAIERKQDQGSLTTSELFDNLNLAIKIAGQIRLSNIEQFMTEKRAIRITGALGRIEWVKVNETDDQGNVINDLTATEADFVVSTQDYRESYKRAALESMTAVLQTMGTFAPQLVMAVFDLVAEESELPNKEEWVSRIRKITGQRDPNKEPTPEELAAEKAQGDAEAEQQALLRREVSLKLDKLQSDIKKMDAESAGKKLDAFMAAMGVAQGLAAAPALAPAADQILKDAGVNDLQAPPAKSIAPGAPAAMPEAAVPMPIPPGQPMNPGTQQ
jgi:hypothetical protein